jgi:hypothetical protein
VGGSLGIFLGHLSTVLGKAGSRKEQKAEEYSTSAQLSKAEPQAMDVEALRREGPRERQLLLPLKSETINAKAGPTKVRPTYEFQVTK